MGDNNTTRKSNRIEAGRIDAIGTAARRATVVPTVSPDVDSF
jgi:hypothetical protein